MLHLCIIPSRYASTRFPGKPLANILDKPMVQWVYERAKQKFEHVYVATDDERIADAVTQFGGKFVLTSPLHASGTDRCAEALLLVEEHTNLNFDVVVNIQGDEPFVQVEHLTLLVEPFQNPEVDISTLVKPFAQSDDIHNPNTPKVVLSNSGKALYFSRSVIPYIRQEEPAHWVTKHQFLKHLGFYAYRSEVLKQIAKLSPSPLEIAESLEQLRWLENGYSIHAGITQLETIAIDTPEDLEKAIEWAKLNQSMR